ncbi:peptidoglycan DD-metalloendopeptidase family protein [uncultured Duncaniella sp.]|jgi:septal ring factor EnvC (AmiA/AmiB activator)|uniref:murein hydrolase activator EnvC family protein n=1 Tax=Duncaniella dubosii TaxID=2518971 RepID=UPI0025B15602|nr:peptidoglycan DD-metalloendopeptidase family protein [uncultured Duncaniella sp.]
MPQFSRFWIRCLTIIMMGLMLASSPADAQTHKKRSRTQRTTQRSSAQHRSMETVKKDKSTTERKISETSTKLQTNAKELNRQLNRLNSLNADIATTKNQVAGLRQHIDSLGSAINATADSIKILEGELESMRCAYVKAMKGLQPHTGAASDLSFIFSAETFSEAYSRIRYLRQFTAWRERKVENIHKAIDRIADRRAHLTNLRHSQDVAYRKAEQAKQTLSRQQMESEEMVTKLRKEDSALRQSLNEQKRKAAALDRELDRLIAAEQARIAREEEAARRKAAEAERQRKKKEQAAIARKKNKGVSHSGESTKADTPSAKEVASAKATTHKAASTDADALSGSFASNKGKLLFPVNGKYKIVRPFGRQPHPTLRHVETDNSGIDIEVAPGSTARSIFAGTVSAIFKQDGFNSIVMIRHGRYISIYAGLGSVSVRSGDYVKAGHTLGIIHSDPDDSDRTILHFEIRNERQKLNPSQWVR